MTAKLNLREVAVFRPYPDEFPDELFSVLPHALEDRIAHSEFVRIAKVGRETVAAYAMDRGSDQGFVLHAIVVGEPWRGRGLGRWFVGHAIGVAESKGARYLVIPDASNSRFLDGLGFFATSVGQRFDLVPE